MQTPAILYEPCYMPSIISRVTEADKGIAVAIWHADGDLPVTHQASHVPALEKGDEVLYLHIEVGAYIIARSLQGGERPAKHWQHCSDGKVEMRVGLSLFSLEKSGAVQIKTPHADLSIDQHGKVEINCMELIQAAQGAVQINSGRWERCR